MIILPLRHFEILCTFRAVTSDRGRSILYRRTGKRAAGGQVVRLLLQAWLGQSSLTEMVEKVPLCECLCSSPPPTKGNVPESARHEVVIAVIMMILCHCLNYIQFRLWTSLANRWNLEDHVPPLNVPHWCKYGYGEASNEEFAIINIPYFVSTS